MRRRQDGPEVPRVVSSFIALGSLALLLGTLASCGFYGQRVRELKNPVCALDGQECRQASDCCNECFGGTCGQRYP